MRFVLSRGFARSILFATLIAAGAVRVYHAIVEAPVLADAAQSGALVPEPVARG